MLNCIVNLAEMHSIYLRQITAGHQMLTEAGLIRCEYSLKPELKNEFYHSAIIEVIVDDCRVIYDMTDGYNNYPSKEAYDKMLDNVDIFFKSNISDSYHEGMRNKNKVYSMPPRYNVTIPGAWSDQIEWKKIFRADTTEIKRWIRKIPFVPGSESGYYVNGFEAKPILSNSPKVFFFTRLWDPSIASKKSSQNSDLDGKTEQERIAKKRWEYEQVSNLRSGLVRKLKAEFGNQFIGGIMPDDYAKKNYPDLLGVDISDRKTYTKVLKSAEICVNTQGTHGCYNFSFGEELAASRAIVTEKPMYKEPLYMLEGENYLTYQSIDECIAKVHYLMDNPGAIEKMMETNYNYYVNHLRPDMFVRDTLCIALKREKL